jgi:hypothetical protein
MLWRATMKKLSLKSISMVVMLITPIFAFADSIGIVKTLTGSATIHRDGGLVSAKLGGEVFATDTIETSDNATLGLLLHDDARLSLGPNSTISLDQFSFDKTTDEGNADISIKEGTLSVIAGKMVEKTPGSFKVKTPAAILAVRGTEFSVKVDPTK